MFYNSPRGRRTRRTQYFNKSSEPHIAFHPRIVFLYHYKADYDIYNFVVGCLKNDAQFLN